MTILNRQKIRPDILKIQDDEFKEQVSLQVSSCEILYSDATRFVEKAKKAEVKAILQSWDDMTHVFQGTRYELLPEAKEAINKIAVFTNQIFNI